MSNQSRPAGSAPAPLDQTKGTTHLTSPGAQPGTAKQPAGNHDGPDLLIGLGKGAQSAGVHGAGPAFVVVGLRLVGTRGAETRSVRSVLGG